MLFYKTSQSSRHKQNNINKQRKAIAKLHTHTQEQQNIERVIII